MICKANRETTYPFDAWKLSPSYRVSKVVIVGAGAYRDYKTATGSRHSHYDLYETRELAIASGREKIEAALTRISKQQTKIRLAIASLDRQAGETPINRATTPKNWR